MLLVLLSDSCKQQEQGKSWQEWDLPFKTRNKDALEQVEEEQKELISFIFFQQFEAEKMWNSLHEYAGEHGIEIIGDMPFCPTGCRFRFTCYSRT